MSCEEGQRFPLSSEHPVPSTACIKKMNLNVRAAPFYLLLHSTCLVFSCSSPCYARTFSSFSSLSVTKPRLLLLRSTADNTTNQIGPSCPYLLPLTPRTSRFRAAPLHDAWFSTTSPTYLVPSSLSRCWQREDSAAPNGPATPPVGNCDLFGLRINPLAFCPRSCLGVSPFQLLSENPPFS